MAIRLQSSPEGKLRLTLCIYLKLKTLYLTVNFPNFCYFPLFLDEFSAHECKGQILSWHLVVYPNGA